jgi:hypothetical protein
MVRHCWVHATGIVLSKVATVSAMCYSSSVSWYLQYSSRGLLPVTGCIQIYQLLIPACQVLYVGRNMPDN